MDHLFNDELQQMNERENEVKSKIHRAVSIDDPISILKLNPVVTVQQGTAISEVISIFQNKHIAYVLIVDKNKLLGIFTERDVIRKLIGKNIDIEETSVDEYMTTNPDSLYMEDSIAFALNRMYDGGYRHVPIIDKNNVPVAIVSILDIVSHLAVYYSNEVLNLPPNPQHGAIKSREGG